MIRCESMEAKGVSTVAEPDLRTITNSIIKMLEKTKTICI